MPRSNITTPTGRIKQIPAQSRSTSYGSGLVDSMVSGFGFGMGNNLARTLFEPKSSSEQVTKTTDDIFKKYTECLQRNEPTETCEMLLDHHKKS